MNNIAKLRKAKGISQKQLADLLGFSQQTISNYEQEKTELDYLSIKKIATFFDVSIDYILGNEYDYVFINKTKFKKLMNLNEQIQEILSEAQAQLNKINSKDTKNILNADNNKGIINFQSNNNDNNNNK